jgi:hypothetical protein
MTGNEVRELVRGKLYTLCQYVYYVLADDDAMYPHIVFNLSRSAKYDLARDDITLDVDIFTKDEKEAQDLADAVEKMFNNLNDPQNNFLPTFFTERITNVIESDKSIRHKSVEITVQNYERS